MAGPELITKGSGSRDEGHSGPGNIDRPRGVLELDNSGT